MKIKIILFEDNAELRKSLSLLLTLDERFDLIGSFPNCNDAKNIALYFEPDLVLMDIDMPGMSGVEGVRVIKQQLPQCRVLMHTVFEDAKSLYAAIKNGANGYILKKSGPDNLLQAMIEAYDGGAPITPSIASLILADLNKSLQVNEDYKLTAKEKEVLISLVDGMSYKMIADHLQISIDTVRSHIRKIYDKLHVNSMSEAVAKAIKNKIV